MNCRVVRDRLQAPAERGSDVEEHLRECSACARYSERLVLAHRALRAHRGDFQPDGDFARRAVARLSNEPAELLGWAALRLLPASLVLLLVLAWFAAQVSPDFSGGSTAQAGDDPLIWLLEQPGDAGDPS